MEFKYVLLSYVYTYYCQGTEERDNATALLYVPEDACFEDVRSLLFQRRNKYGHEIDIDSIIDETIKW